MEPRLDCCGWSQIKGGDRWNQDNGLEVGKKKITLKHKSRRRRKGNEV
jgi:hypothetical protein